jgi:hypothetical protein
MFDLFLAVQHDALPSSTSELHALLSIPELKGVPLLIVRKDSFCSALSACALSPIAGLRFLKP